MKVKRIMAMVLCVAMVLSTMNFNVFAVDNEIIIEEDIIANVAGESALSITEDTTIVINGDVTLCGAKGGAGIYVAEDATLTIKGEGTLTAIGNGGKDTSDSGAAGIGGTYANGNSGKIVIDGVKVTAYGYGVHGSGIGSGSGEVVGEIQIINGADVTAYGGYYADGCGTTLQSKYGKSDPEGGAAIGGGAKTVSEIAPITIKNSKVTAYGGSKAAAIGANFWSSVSSINITESNVTAQGGSSSAAIGTSRAGDNGVSSNITINDSKVVATGGAYGAGIGAGYNNDSLGNGAEESALPLTVIKISGGEVTATGGEGGAAIGGGYKSDNIDVAIKDGAKVTARAGELVSDKTVADGGAPSAIGTGANGSGKFENSPAVEIDDSDSVIVYSYFGGKDIIEGVYDAENRDNISVNYTNIVAKINDTGFSTFQEAIESIGDGNVVIELYDDASFDIDAWQTIAIGGETTETITINGNGNTLTFNKKNSDWNNIATNNDATLILNDMKITDSGYNNGPWNRYDLNFACDVELNNVISTKALAFKADAKLKNVTINEDGDNYAIWIQPNGQKIAIDGFTVNSAGRGIKIDEQYVDAPEKVTLSVVNATFTTAKKAAILVKCSAGAEIALNNVDISGVVADTINAVWNDADSAADFDKITVKGSTLAQEDASEFATTVTSNGNVVGYYKSIQAAVDAAQDGDVITVISDHEIDSSITVESGITDDKYAVLVNASGKDITIDLAGHKITANIGTTQVFGIFAADKNGKLTLTDSSEDKTGEVNITNNNYLYSVLFVYDETAELVVDGGKYIVNAVKDSLIYAQHNEIITINDGYFSLGNVGTGTNGSPWIVNVKGAGDNHVIVNGGTFPTDINRQFWSNEVLVPETHYTVTNADGTYTVKEGAVAYVNEGMITGPYFKPKNIGYKSFEEAVEAAVTKNDSPITLLQNAEVTGNVVIGEDIALNCGDYSVVLASETATLTAPEGLDVTTNLEGYLLVYTNGTYALNSVVAQIGEVEYGSMADAIAAAQDDDTITVVSDIENEEKVTIDNKNIVIDLCDHTFNGSILVPTGNVTIKNGSIVNTDKEVSAIEINSGKLNLTNVNVDSARHAVRIDGEVAAVIDGGIYRSAIGTGKGTYHAVNVSGDANVVIKNGTFTGPKGTSADSGAAVNVQAGATVTIEDGTFTGGKNNTLASKGTLSVIGGTFDQDPTAYVAENHNVTYDSFKKLYTVTKGWRISAEAEYGEVKAGESVMITIKASGENFTAADWKLNYEADKFDFAGIVTDIDYSDLHKADKSYISGVVMNTQAQDAYNNDTVLAVYKFTAKKLTEEVTGKFTLTDASVGTVAMASSSYPAATPVNDEVKILLNDFTVSVKYKGNDVSNNKVDIPYDGNAHKIDVTTEPDAKVWYSTDEGQNWVENVPEFTEYGEHKLTYKVDVPDGYDQTAKTPVTITVNIIDPEKFVEVVDYVSEYKLVLVYTKVDNAYFTYGDRETLMLDVTAAGYQYTDDAGNTSDETYKVYGYVVPREMVDEETAQDDDFYKNKVKFAANATGEPVSVNPYDYNVNCDPSAETIANLADVVYTSGVFNTKDTSMEESYMKAILKADVCREATSLKCVNNDDITAVKNNYTENR